MHPSGRHLAGCGRQLQINADASPGVSAELAFGALPRASIDAIAWTTLTVGAVALIGGGLLLFFGVRRSTGAVPPLGFDAGLSASWQFSILRRPGPAPPGGPMA